MRHSPFIWLVLGILLSSCGPIVDRRTLNEMEALMPERPDSALAVLQDLEIRDLPGLHVRPLHALLLSEALDKNYIDITDDSLALAANKYYGTHGSKLHRLKSWYYLGRIRFNAGNYAEAVICYNKSLEYANSISNYHYIGLINREIANAYTRVWDNFHAIEYIERSIEAFNLAGERRYSEYSYLALARLYRTQKEYAQSRETAKWIIDNSSEEYLVASAYELDALLELSKPDCDIEKISSSLNAAKIGPLLPENTPNLCTLAMACQLSGKVDSADYYLNKASISAASQNDSISVAYSKYRIAFIRKDYQTACDYLEQYLDLQDPALYRVLEQSLSFYQGHYYQEESRVNAMKAQMTALSLGFIIVLLTILAVFLLSRNGKMKAKIIDEMARTAEVRQDLDNLRDKKQEMGRLVATLFENHLNILQKLSEQYDLIDEGNNRKKQDKTRDEIISSFRRNMRDLQKDKDVNLSMEDTVDIWKDGIMSRFREVFGNDYKNNPRMSEEDFELVPYYFSGMKQRTISFLTGYTEHAIKERKHRIKQKIESLDFKFSDDKNLFLSNL